MVVNSHSVFIPLALLLCANLDPSELVMEVLKQRAGLRIPTWFILYLHTIALCQSHRVGFVSAGLDGSIPRLKLTWNKKAFLSRSRGNVCALSSHCFGAASLRCPSLFFWWFKLFSAGQETQKPQLDQFSAVILLEVWLLRPGQELGIDYLFVPAVYFPVNA